MAGIGYTTIEGVRLAEMPASRDGRHLTLEGIQLSAVALDLILVWASAILSRWVWSDPGFTMADAITEMTPLGVFGALLFVAFLVLRHAYSADRLSSPVHQLRLVAEGWAFSFFVIGWGAFLLKSSAELSRGAISIHFVVGLIGVASVHVAGARWLGSSFARSSLSLRRVAIIALGDEQEFEPAWRDLEAKGIEIVSRAVISPGRSSVDRFPARRQVAADAIRSALARVKLDGIYLFIPWRERREIDEMLAVLGPMPVPIQLFADPDTARLLDRPRIRVGALRGFELRRAPLSRIDRMVKRLVDLVVAGGAIVLLSPLMGLTALAILVETGRPVLFRQTRRGFGARPFQILKFRSMTVQENGDRVTQATKGDARVTRLGRILRKTSVDELPQLFNVLRGDMSIVGPRPHAVAHDDHYDSLIATYAFRQHVKPGITGWAQINGHRGETREVDQMSARVEHDLWYIANWSPWLDLKIIALTAIKILNDEKAY